MIWNADGAEAVARVRAWLKSERWEEAIALRGVRRRGYRRKQVAEAAEQHEGHGQVAQEQASQAVEPHRTAQQKRSADVLAQVQAERAAQRGKNGWGQAWSVRRQREMAAQRTQATPVSTA